MKLETGRVVAGRYKIDEQLGMGGMAVVYRAKDVRLDRFVTLKVLREDYTADEEFIGRFDIEARAAASLQNPNIVSIYDSGQDGDIYYIVFEYVNGSTLKELIARKAPFDNKTTLGVAIQIASGLADAHQHKIIHRDIKPQNILVTADHSVKITDFGIARAAKSATLDGSSDMMGSAHYFSPEQARGGYIDTKSDIYSLGIVMFEMATGRVPFEDDAVVAIALKHINEPLPDINELNPNVTESIIRIIKRAAEKSTSRRYGAVTEMMDDLKRALTDESGLFVETSKDYKDSPTKSITNEDLNEIKKAKREMQNGNPDEFEEEDGFSESDEYEEEYEEEYEDDYEYEDRYENRHYNKPKPNADKKKERLVIIAAIATALIFILLITWGAWTVYNNAQPQPVTVIDLTGKTYDEAEAAAAEISLGIAQTGEYSGEEPGTVIRQAEQPGETLKENEVIHVFVSMGPENITLPDVTDSEVGDAFAALTELGVTVTETPIEDEEKPTGIVVMQDPAAGEAVPPGSEVNLFVATGPDTSMTEVPTLIGKTEADALELLEEADLVPGLSEKEESMTYKEGMIIDQTVEPGEMAERGSSVSYTISIGGTKPTASPATPEPEPTVDPNTPVTKVIPINLWAVPEGTQEVDLMVVKVEGNNPAVTVFSSNVPVSDFPFPIPVTGMGQVEIQVYGDGLLMARDVVDFSS